MKILHVNSYYNAGKFYKNLYDQQVTKGLDISVYVPVNTSYENKTFDFGKYTSVSRNHKKFDRYIFHLKHHKILRDIQKKYDINDFTMIHAHSLFSNGYVAMKLKEKYGIPYIVAVRNTDVNVFFRKMIHLRKMGIKILNDAEYVIFLSEPYRDTVIEKYVPETYKRSVLKKSMVIPNGIDDFWFDNLAEIRDIKKPLDIRLVQTGDINRNKNIETTVEAVSILKEKGFNVRLDVVGKIKDENVFAKIKKYDFVNYLGFRSKQELLEIYRNNDIFVLPSVTETFGLVYPEAMSQGLPVIYSKGQGFDGQFKEGEVGYGVNSFDASEIANRIMDILSDYNAISANVRTKINKFKWDSISDQYIYLYQGIGSKDDMNRSSL